MSVQPKHCFSGTDFYDYRGQHLPGISVKWLYARKIGEFSFLRSVNAFSPLDREYGIEVICCPSGSFTLESAGFYENGSIVELGKFQGDFTGYP